MLILPSFRFGCGASERGLVCVLGVGFWEKFILRMHRNMGWGNGWETSLPPFLLSACLGEHSWRRHAGASSDTPRQTVWSKRTQHDKSNYQKECQSPRRAKMLQMQCFHRVALLPLVASVRKVRTEHHGAWGGSHTAGPRFHSVPETTCQCHEGPLLLSLQHYPRAVSET